MRQERRRRSVAKEKSAMTRKVDERKKIKEKNEKDERGETRRTERSARRRRNVAEAAAKTGKAYAS